jgi:hypothetical protein
LKLSRRAVVGQAMQSWYGDEANTGNAAGCGMCGVSFRGRSSSSRLWREGWDDATRYLVVAGGAVGSLCEIFGYLRRIRVACGPSDARASPGSGLILARARFGVWFARALPRQTPGQGVCQRYRTCFLKLQAIMQPNFVTCTRESPGPLETTRRVWEPASLAETHRAFDSRQGQTTWGGKK